MPSSLLSSVSRISEQPHIIKMHHNNSQLAMPCTAVEENRLTVYAYIQGDSGGICITLGNDSMCDSKNKS